LSGVSMESRRLLVVILLLFPVISSCRTSINDETLRNPVKQLTNYSFDKNSPLISRVKKTPPIVLSAWSDWDGMKNYSSYTPDNKEIKIIEKYVKLLPSLIQGVMKERMIGIYFVNNFLGSGLTDWVLDSNNKVYTYMIFNPETLKKNMSELITWKERTCFIPNDSSICLLYTSPSPRDVEESRMPSSA